MMRRKRTSLLIGALLLAACVLSCSAFGGVIEGTVTRVYDGDTIWVGDVKVRLFGIDAPETKQEFGPEATEYLGRLIGNKEVRVVIKGKDRNGRALGIVFLGGMDINRQMLEDGCAWHYKQYDNTESYAGAENYALALRRGLWAYPDPIPPWEFRKGVRHQPIQQQELPPGVVGYGPDGWPIFVKETYGGFIQSSAAEKAFKRAKQRMEEKDMRIWNNFLMSSEGRLYLKRKRHDGVAHPRVCFERGVRYENGVGVKQNIREAVYWYRRAVEGSERRDQDAIEALRRLGCWD